MNFLPRRNNPNQTREVSSTKKRTVRIILFILALIVVAFGAFALKTGFALNKITQGDGNIFKSILKSLPGADKSLEGEKEGVAMCV